MLKTVLQHTRQTAFGANIKRYEDIGVDLNKVL